MTELCPKCNQPYEEHRPACPLCGHRMMINTRRALSGFNRVTRYQCGHCGKMAQGKAIKSWICPVVKGLA